MVVQINSCINVADLVDTLNASPTRAANLKHKIYYLLSLLTDTNDNYRLNSNNGGFHNMCSIDLKKVLGSRDFYTIRNLLLNPNDPIIELDKSWLNPNGTDCNGYCQGYKITPKYNNGVVIFKSIPTKLAKIIFKQTKRSESITSIPDYGCLLSQFECNTISFDPLVYDYIYSFGHSLLDRIHDNNPYQFKLVHNIIGRWLYYIEQISEGKTWRKVSEKNHRLNSSITNLPRLLRGFLLLNGEQMSCVDISSSQPYILSSIIKRKFYSETTEGYNIKTIYPELYKELIEYGYIDTNINYSSNAGIEFYTNHTGCNNNFYSNNSNNSSSFMWCNFFTSAELDSINQYTLSPFYLDFYKHIIDMYNTNYSSQKYTTQKDDRDKLKNTMMFVLFDDNRNHRNNNHYIQIFQTVFPGVERWINLIHKIIGKQRFSYLLQRAESYLLLNVVCREYIGKYPLEPIITIHDGVFTTKDYVQKLNLFVLKRLHELTEVLAGCKIKTSQIDPNPQINDIEREWAKIEPINTEEKYLKNINGVFISNITRGSEFLKKNW